MHPLACLRSLLAPRGGKGPSSPKLALPWPLFYGPYALTVSVACCLAGLVAYSGSRDGRSPVLLAVATGASIFASVIAPFVFALIGYASSGRDEERPHILSRCYFHAVAFAFIALSWLALGIFFVHETIYECGDKTARCKYIAVCTSLAFMLSIFSFLSAAFVTLAVHNSCLPWSTHVDKARYEAELRRKGKENDTDGSTIAQKQIFALKADGSINSA